MRIKPPTRGPLFPDRGPLLPRLARRIGGISAEVLAFILVTILLVPAILVMSVVDLVLWLKSKKPPTGVRLALMAWWFLFGEMQALIGLLLIWIFTGGPFGVGSLRRTRGLYALRIHWAASHLGGFRVLFGLDFQVEDIELANPGPMIMMMRHASIIDNTLPDALVGRTNGIGLRFVIKKELQALPTIDIGGRWAPTVFIRRASDDPEAELTDLRSLTQGLGDGEAVLIYPEGTRPTPAKLKRAQEVIAERQPEIAPMAERLNHILPPRLGGPIGLIDESPTTDVVLCGHTGFDGLRSIGDIWGGALVGQTIRVRFWRFPAEEIPKTEEERTVWLYEKWQMLDDWVGEQLL